METSITQHGITWTWDEDLVVGQFANGEYYVVAPNGLTLTGPVSLGGRNGTMINPNSANIWPSQGYDDRIDLTYSAGLNIGTQMPYAVSAGSSVISCSSRETLDDRNQLQVVALLTVLGSAPLAGSFRPTWFGTDKTIKWNKSEIDYSILRDLPILSGAPSMSATAEMFSHSMVLIGTSYKANYALGYDNTPTVGANYGREISLGSAFAGLVLNSNYSDAEKETLAVRYIQWGLDCYEGVVRGQRFEGNGGQMNGHKLATLTAGWLLNDSAIIARCAGTLSHVFAEDNSHFYVSQYDIDTPRSTNTAGGTRPIDPYPQSALGMPEWASNYDDDPTQAGYNWGRIYRVVTCANLVGNALAAKIMGMEAAWAQPAFFDYYTQRYVPIERALTDAINPWVLSMWDAYGDTATSITQHGITWTFDKNYSTGQYANGDWWVVGPVTITNITPASTLISGRTMHGSMINPSAAPFPFHGFDSTLGGGANFSTALNIGRPGGSDISVGNPLVVVNGSSLVSVKSVQGEDLRPQLTDVSILTVVASAPIDGSFRPPYCGTDKTHHWNKSDLDYSILNRLPPVAGAKTPNQAAASFAKPWFELGTNSIGRNFHPANHMPEYGRDMGILLGEALLVLNLDYNPAEKELLYIRLVQWGIDLYGCAVTGGVWAANGGHNCARKAGVVLAALALDDDNIKIFADAAQKFIFAEDQQTWYVVESDVGRPLYSDDGRPRVPYIAEDVGIAEWGEKHSQTPTRDGRNWDTYYRNVVYSGQVGEALSMKFIKGAKALWNWPPFFDYFDRAHAIYSSTGSSETPTFVQNMWDADAYSVTTGLPPGLTLNRGTGVISGTPAAAGEYLLTLTATNASGTGTLPIVINISPAGPDVPVGLPSGWTSQPWTNDETSGIIGTSVYTVAVNLHGDAITVNGVPFEAGTGRTNFSIGGTVQPIGDTTNVTGASGVLASSFIYGGKPRTVTLTGLTPGVRYETSLFSTGWEAVGREQVFASGIHTLTLDQDAYGKDNGICIKYTFVASAATQLLTITPVTDKTFHLAALANRQL